MTTTQIHVEAFLIVGAALLVTVIWMYVFFMLGRVLRWTYLEKKAIHRPSRRSWTPPEMPTKMGRYGQ